MQRRIVHHPQVAPAIHARAHSPVGREDLRERGGNAGAENELVYAITTIYEGTIGNAVRAFHGSIRGTVNVTSMFEVEGQQYALMRVVLWDRLGAESGTRYPPILNGYSGEGPRSVLPNEPFGTDGMFRTKLVYYDMNVLYPIPK